MRNGMTAKGGAALTWAIAGALLAGVGASWAQDERKKGAPDPESMLLELNKVKLGTISTEDDKKRFLYTIQLEKARIGRRNLEVIYENAYDLYKSGDFEGTQELTSKILAIDPSYEAAATLQRAAVELKGTGVRPGFSENKLVDRRFDDAMNLYRQGRLVEASERMNEVVQLSVFNLKARYWLKKINRELAEEHYRRGEMAYRQHRPQETLDQWYSALVLYPQFPRLVSNISRVESEVRQADANEKLQTALQLYSQGRNDETLKALDDVLKIQPGDARATRLQNEIRSEIANQHVEEGRRKYAQRQYTAAIEQFKKAVQYGYDPRAADLLIARTKEQMRLEAEAKKRAEEAEAERKRKEAEDAERKRKEAEEAAKRAQDDAKKQQLTPDPGIQPKGVTEENRRAAENHQIQGLNYFSNGNYDKAKEEWIECTHLDPSNADCAQGLQRIEQLLNGP